MTMNRHVENTLKNRLSRVLVDRQRAEEDVVDAQARLMAAEKTFRMMDEEKQALEQELAAHA